MTKMMGMAATTGEALSPHPPGSGLSPLVMSPHSGSYNHLIWQEGKLRNTESSRTQSQGNLLTSESFLLGTISNCPYVSNRKPKESPEGTWLDKVQLTLPHVGCGLEHRRQRQRLQEARPGCRQLPDAWGQGRTVWDWVCSEPSGAGFPYPLPTYLGGPFAAASSGPAARPRQH